MPEEPEAELQASAANLSPVSPSPVHTASPLVVPALQDTVDTIDAMVAAAAATNGDVAAVDSNGAQPHDAAQPSATEDVDVVDDDDDPYGDEDTAEPAQVEQPAATPENGNDDYAKAFDSPINSELAEGNEQPLASEGSKLSSHELPQSDPTRAVSDTSSAQHKATATPVAQPIAEPERPASHPEVQALEGIIPSNETQKPPVDISQLVASLTAQYSDPSKLHSPNPASGEQPQNHQPSAAPQPSASLPARPPQPDVQPQVHPAHHHPGGSNPGFPSVHDGGAPGTSAPPPVAGGYPSQAQNPYAAAHDVQHSSPPYAGDQPTYPAQNYGAQPNQLQHAWDQFIADERQYMSEAKWDRFPEGSRIFIGNLSSDKVSKRDVFDMFHAFGRLAQISLKSAYGFVQYHTPEEGRRAIDALEGAEVKGRRIHLEVSKLQDKSKKDRQRSPDRNRRDGGRFNDRHGSQRNDYRGRDRTPPRGDYHNDSYSSKNNYGRRDRSRSPGYGRSSRDSYDNYRRRSPSPYGQQQHQQPELDLPKRYGADVPDVQLILQDDLNRDFVSWVEGAFKSKGLRTHTMFLHPRMPKDQVIQRQAAEGVHGVVELDLRAQNMSKIPIQAFDRSGGSQNVRFDQYQDLDPIIAAEVLTRTKATSAPAGYGQPPQTRPSSAYPPQGYPTHQQPPHQQPPPNPYYPPQQHSYTPQQPPPQQPGQADLASVLSQVDPNTLQQILAAAGHGQQQPQAGSVQPDLQAILGSLSASAPQQPQPQGHHGAAYYGQQPAPNGGGDNATEVQNIMASLARYRQ